MRNFGYSIFDIFLSNFFGQKKGNRIIFLLFLNIKYYMEKKYDIELDNNENSLYSIKIYH